MGTSRKPGSSNNAHTFRISSTALTKASLPPKPASQKRTRNTSNMPPPAQASATRRASAQKGWSRRSASWTAEEDARLIDLVKKESAIPPSITASKTWSRVASQLTNRTGKQCRERYLNQLKPGIRRDPWSPDEERILRETHARVGNKWVTIANQLPGRTDNCVKNHWNSMLRKRQRREAALRATEAEVAATLGKSREHKGDLDGKSEAELSMHTGCATPSGASSSYHDLPTSGIPSPYTASSPITPKRDSKLQISTLVASSTKELPTWNVPYQRHESSASVGYNARTMLGLGSKQAIKAPGTPVLIHDNYHQHGLSNQSFGLPTSAIRLPTESSSPLLGIRAFSPSNSYMSKDTAASPMQCIASSPRVPQLMQNNRTDSSASNAVIEPQVRRSSRLLSSSSKISELGSTTLNEAKAEFRKRNIDNGILGETAGGNALAALAAAASSVPPSPLTPESRFSTTSRSRSVSPDPRVWPVQSKTMGANVLTRRLKRRKISDSTAGALSDDHPGACVRATDENHRIGKELYDSKN